MKILQMVYSNPFFILVYLPMSYQQVNSQITCILGIGLVSLQKGLSHPQQFTDCFFSHSFLKLLLLKTNTPQYIHINHAYRHIRMGTSFQKHPHHWFLQQWRWHISSTNQFYNANLSSFTSTTTYNSIPKARTRNYSRIRKSIHLQITQWPQ